MRILLTANITPFLHGGADYHINGLHQALRQAGFETELLRFPFRFSPGQDILNLMDYCSSLDMNTPNGMSIDRVISLQFPGYGLQHQHHWVWLMHQHRAVYELYDRQPQDRETAHLREAIRRYDGETLGRAEKVFANSTRVAERLQQYNGIASEPLHHPPAHFERFCYEETLPYVLYPSRLETLKRQDLLIEAARHLRSPVKILLMGEGGQYARYQALIAEHDLGGRVLLLGRATEAEKIAYYAHALAVCFIPFDEDYGYITLEAMLSAKPVITTSDSGGPLAFVQHGQTGWVCEPDPRELATAIDEAYEQPAATRAKGLAGRSLYGELGITWDNVVERLTAEV